jgi:general stress protein 26
MTKSEIVEVLEMILTEAHTAVLATSDEEGRPRMRWMTPALIRGRTGAIFSVTSPGFTKVHQLTSRPEVEWLFQTPVLDTIVTVRGKINIVENPSLLSEVIEALGPYMRSFWKLKGDQQDVVVLETIIEEATYYKPMKGLKEVVRDW